MTSNTSSRADTAAADRSGQTRNLIVTTVAFTISFWAWNVIAPLGVFYARPDQLDLSAGERSLLVALPILVGSLGRIPAGVLTPRFGGRVMFTVLLLASVPFVLLVALAGSLGSFPLLLVFAFFLGIAGTTFAVGIPFLNAWYEPSKRGMATGVFGAGMGGTALSAFFTPRFREWFGYVGTHVIIAVALVLAAAAVWLLVRDAPGWQPNRENPVGKLVLCLKLPITWQMSFLYAAAFGGFVAFSTYLPTYLNDVYDISDLKSAGARTAGFAIAAVLARPLGGALSDRFGPRPITAISCAGAALLAVWMITRPSVESGMAAVDFIGMAIMMGLGSGAVFSWVAKDSPANRVGGITGLVGAAGGIGGFFPPMVMGATYDAATHSYTIGLSLLCAFAAAAALYTVFGIRRATVEPGR